MKKKPSSKSAFFTPRVLIALAICATGALLALLAFALYPGGRAFAQVLQQDESSIPDFIEHVNVAQGTVVRITAAPMEGSGFFDLPALMGQPPLEFPPSPSDTAGTGPALTLNVSPADPAQASPTPTPPGSVVLLDTFTNGTVSFTSSVPRTYMGDGFTNNTLPGGTTYFQIRSYTFYMVSAAAVTYTDVHARLALWNNHVQANTPVYTHQAAFFDVEDRK